MDDLLTALLQIAALRSVRNELPPGLLDIERIAIDRLSKEDTRGQITVSARGGVMWQRR